MLPVWELLLIIIFSLIGLYLLAIMIVYFFMKRAQKRAFSSLDSMIVYEKDRMNFINDLVNTLKDNKYNLKSNIKIVVDEQNELLENKMVDMSKVKQQTDFLLIYFQKYLKENGIRKKSPFDSFYKKINDYLIMDIDSDDYPYKKYNLYANRYNSILSLGFLCPFARSIKNPQAPIL